MSTEDRIADASLDQRVVLLGIACHSTEGTTPVDSTEIRAVCRDRLQDPEGPVFGRLSEGDVMSALYRLESAGLVDEVGKSDLSATGKGRPKYDLAVEPDRVFDELTGDERVADLVARIRDDGQ